MQAFHVSTFLPKPFSFMLQFSEYRVLSLFQITDCHGPSWQEKVLVSGIMHLCQWNVKCYLLLQLVKVTFTAQNPDFCVHRKTNHLTDLASCHMC